jgi:hypothetical protein
MKRAVALIVLGVIWVSSVMAQNLLDNEDYRRARELRAEAQTALDRGEYEEAESLALEAEEYSRRAERTAEDLRDRYRAVNAQTRARRHINEAERMNAEDFFPELWAEAIGYYDEGTQQLEDEQWLECIETFAKVGPVVDRMRRTPRPK